MTCLMKKKLKILTVQTYKESNVAKTKKTKLNEVIFKSYRDTINKRMAAGHDVSGLTKRLNTLIAQHSN
jgi:hypothetical protein